jgi:ring-1,2-phenylacetyl-CoA epoxidase subunit PaaC
MNNNLLNYTIHLADNAHILGHRLGEWCGHGPILEQDIALTNISLDLIGQARSLYQYAAELEGKGRTEDDIAYLRDAWDFRNVLLTEQPNGDFGKTIVRQFLFDVYNFLFYKELRHSKDQQLAAIAEKSLKEVTYHLRFSSEWVIRLGDGTEVSNQKVQNALDDLWMFTGELMEMNDFEKEMVKAGIGVDLEKLKALWHQKMDEILNIATLTKPANNWMQSGGKTGNHSEYLGLILAEMQFLQKTYPGQVW